ncbi:hypothetical protein LTS12_027381, partial [Elasticomyces elasticus]
GTIEWTEIADQFKTLERLQGRSVTELKIAENGWKTCVKSYRFPRRWDQMVQEKFMSETTPVHNLRSNHSPHGELILRTSTSPRRRIQKQALGLLSRAQNSRQSSPKTKAVSRMQTHQPPRSLSAMEVWIAKCSPSGNLDLAVTCFRMSPPDPSFQLYDVVSGKLFRWSFQQIKQHTDLDFKNMKSNKDDLREKDFADLAWFDTATQRRGLEPEGGWASQP